MTLYAFDDIDDALAATRALLWPVDVRRWAKLAVVAFFVGGAGGGFNPLQFSTGTPPSGRGGVPRDLGSLPDVPADALAVVVGVVAVAVVLGVLFAVVGSIMEFVFVESLRREAVALRRYWGERWRQGLRLFGFRLVLGVASLVVFGALAAVVLLPFVLGEGTISIPLLLLAIPVFVVLAIASGLVHGFTTVFVVPVMVVEGCGVLAGWRLFWPTLTDQWKQYVAYAVMGFVLQLAAGVVAGIATLVGALVLAIPFVVVGLVAAAVLSVSSTAGLVVIGLVVAVYLLVMLVVLAVVGVPIQAFLRYYALLVLGDTEPAFDLVAERRAAIRGGEAGE